jgi:hypothetical protein
MSTKKSKIEFVPLLAVAPWEALGDYACFSLDTAYKTFTYFFRPAKSSKESRVNFKSNTTFWIDNVTLQEITPKMATGGESLILVYSAIEEPQPVPINGRYVDLDGKDTPDPLMLPGYGSIILLKRP